MTDTRRRWTSGEDALLFDLYQIQEKAPTGKCQKINWNEIARHIPGRSNKDCRKRYYNRFTGGLRKGSWTQDEDDRLFQLVERYQYRWAMIAQKMETRNADQCSKRWHHCLNPELERSPWTDKENELLLSAVGTHGSSWKDIQRCHFPTRSANNIKNQYTILSRRSLNPTHLRPCCQAPASAGAIPHGTTSAITTTTLKSNTHQKPPRRPLSSTTSLASATSSYDAYGYTSLSSTPQLSGTEYLPSTPDTSGSGSGSGDLCGYLAPYPSPSSFFGNLADGSGLMMGDGGLQMGDGGLQMGYGLDLEGFGDGVGGSGHGYGHGYGSREGQRQGQGVRYGQFQTHQSFGL
ncbi:hypothetical protein BJY04DRAFT_230331 [Aspergillus karnatakaensis]|uniref:SANT/Myb-like DNA-binding domain-containing protein n=1 Tax=Aspergillus karnatakaensis TaxID=1810916 RepID=UPI003CCD6453